MTFKFISRLSAYTDCTGSSELALWYRFMWYYNDPKTCLSEFLYPQGLYSLQYNMCRKVSFACLMVFSFVPKNVHLIKKKNTILCLFLKNVSPSKRVVCFILNNFHFPMVEGIAFYALYKSRLLIIAIADNSNISIIIMKFKKSRLVSLSNLKFIFFIVLWSNLKETLHY